MDLKKTIREIQDYPVPGISFKDITTLLNDAEAIKYTTKEIVDYFKNKGITKVVGLEARGFIFGGILANELGVGFVPARKKGKLPFSKFSETYNLEYGQSTIEIHSDSLSENDVVLVHDDLLATGGTATAVLNLLNKMRVKRISFSFICELEFLKTKNKEIIKQYDNHVLVKY